jgi:hypothetical protein
MIVKPIDRLTIEDLRALVDTYGPRWDNGGRLFGGYATMMRRGIVEAVDSTIIRRREGGLLIPPDHFERSLIHVTRLYLENLAGVGVPPPAFLILTLAGVRGARMWMPAHAMAHPFDTVRGIERDVLRFPEVLVEDYGADASTLIRPVLDAVWQAAGYAASPNYGSDGNWQPRGY